MRTFALVVALTLAAGCGEQEKADPGTPDRLVVTSAEQLPGAVAAGFRELYPGAAIQRAERMRTSAGQVLWKIELTDQNGRKQQATIDSQGSRVTDDRNRIETGKQ